MKKWDELASDEAIEKVVSALKENNIEAKIVENGSAAKDMILSLIPKGSEVMTMSSVTLETIGVTKLIQESGNYVSVKNQLIKMDRATEGEKMRKIGAAPSWAIGSIHALTMDGHTIIASNTGSQLPAYTYGSTHVIWVVGSQKIVSNVNEGMERLYSYVVPLEDKHMHQLHGVGTAVNKLLIFNKEKIPGRVTIILVKEKLGF